MLVSVVFRTSLLRKNEKGQRIHLSRLVSAFFPRGPSINSLSLSLLEIEPCDHRTPISMSVPAEVEASASGSAWVSDLALRDSSDSGCESGLPKRTSMTSPSTIIGSSSSGSPSSVMSAKCRVRPSRTASVRFGNSDVTISISFRFCVGCGPHLCAIALVQAGSHGHPDGLVSSRLRFFTQDAHARSTPSLGSIHPSVYEDGFSSHQYPLWLPLSTVGTTHPWEAATRTASLRRIS